MALIRNFSVVAAGVLQMARVLDHRAKGMRGGSSSYEETLHRGLAIPCKVVHLCWLGGTPTETPSDIVTEISKSQVTSTTSLSPSCSLNRQRRRALEGMQDLQAVTAICKQAEPLRVAAWHFNIVPGINIALQILQTPSSAFLLEDLR